MEEMRWAFVTGAAGWDAGMVSVGEAGAMATKGSKYYVLVGEGWSQV